MCCSKQFVIFKITSYGSSIVHFLNLTIREREREIGRGRERDLPSAGSLPKSLKQLGLGQRQSWEL